MGCGRLCPRRRVRRRTRRGCARSSRSAAGRGDPRHRLWRRGTDQAIAERGATVVGIDNSESMVIAAKARGLDARLMDAAQLRFSEAFDAAFSNATLHWVLDKERAARSIWFALKPGGRFAGEMGGAGNLAALREALDDMLVARGYGPPTYAANWYPSPEEFAAVYEQAGFGTSTPGSFIARRRSTMASPPGSRPSARAGSTERACPRANAPRSPRRSPRASPTMSRIMSAFASS